MSPSRPFHPATGRDLAADAGDRAGRPGGLQVPAALGLAAGRLPHHPGADALPGRQPRGDEQHRHGAARAPVRPDGRASTGWPRPARRASPSSPCSSRSARRWTSPSKRCRRRSTRAARCCRQTCPRRRSMPRSTRPTRRCSRSPSPPTRLPLTEVQNLVNTRLAQKISQVSGVGLVSLSGGQRPAVRIQADAAGAGRQRHRPGHPAHRHHRRQRQRRQGQRWTARKRAYTINANDQLVTVDDYKNLIVSYKNGAPIRHDQRRPGGRWRREHAARRLGRYRLSSHGRLATAGRMPASRRSC